MNTRTNPFTLHSFSPKLSKNQYWAAYLKWMQKTNHPDLVKSNLYADKYRSELELKRPP